MELGGVVSGSGVTRSGPERPGVSWSAVRRSFTEGNSVDIGGALAY